MNNNVNNVNYNINEIMIMCNGNVNSNNEMVMKEEK